jgi:hypothetical protein
VGFFFYRYGVRLGFLDGAAGFYYATLQGLWFRALLDAKLTELEDARRRAVRDESAGGS